MTVNEEMKKAFLLVERELRNRTAEGRRCQIDIYPGSFSGVRLEINGEVVWASTISAAIEDLSNSK